MARIKLFLLWKWMSALCMSILIFSCSDNNDPEPDFKPEESNLVEATPAGTWAASQLQLLIQLSGRDINVNFFAHDVDIYRVVYKTAYLEGEIEASGLVLLPKTTADAPMISFQRGTIVAQSDAPSVQTKESEQVVSYAALASMGFITVVPDLIGFGRSKDIFHPYFIEEPTADAVRDLILAARALAVQKNINFDDRLFLAGYSQGGYATLSAHKSLESEPLEGVTLVASFPGAGGYDIAQMLDYFRGVETYNDPYYLAYVGMSYKSYYEHNDLLSGFFNEPYATRIPSLFDGIKSGAQINAQLTNEMAALVNEAIRLDPASNPVYDFLSGSFAENSLTDWTPEAPIFLYHGDADLTVPLGNSQSVYQRLLDNGANATNIELIVLPGDHTSAVGPYIEDIVKKLQEMK